MPKPAEEDNLLKVRLGYLLLVVYFTSQISLLFVSRQQNLISVLLPYFFAFGSYVLLIRKELNISSVYFLLKIGIVLRLLAVFAFPHLSDDVYRYWWDGTLLSNGINPFSFTPAEILNSTISPDLRQSLAQVFPNLNSPEYRTVYPGFSQLLFYLGVLISGKNLYLFSIALKLFFLIGDILLLYVVHNLTRKLNLPLSLSVIYFLNPLVITELSGNLHFELWLILFFGWSVLYFLENKYLKSGIFLGLSIISKITTAFFTPLLLSTKSLKQTVYFILACMLLFIGTQVLFINDLQHLQGYFLYIRQFEFNSMIYGPLEQYFIHHNLWVLKSKTGMITGGIFLSIYTWMIGYHFYKVFKKSSLVREVGSQPFHLINLNSSFNFQLAWWIFFSYLLLSSTVHPWYLATLLFIGVFSYPFISIVWTGLIMTSYIHYDVRYEAYFNVVKILEYSVLLLSLAFTLFNQQKRISR
ncbi:MAG: hypothetical protein WAT21_11610 [Saprospiraceae bacterium]